MGLYPLNPMIFSDDVFLPADTYFETRNHADETANIEPQTASTAPDETANIQVITLIDLTPLPPPSVPSKFTLKRKKQASIILSQEVAKKSRVDASVKSLSPSTKKKKVNNSSCQNKSRANKRTTNSIKSPPAPRKSSSYRVIEGASTSSRFICKL